MTLSLKKHKDLIRIIESEQSKRKNNERGFQENFEKMEISDLDEDALEVIVQKLKLTEVERDVNNNRTMMAETVLPILEKIDPKAVSS